MEYLILSEYKHINTTNTDGTKAVYTPDMDVSGEDAEIQSLANKHWTQEVKDAWADKLSSEEIKGVSE